MTGVDCACLPAAFKATLHSHAAQEQPRPRV